MHLWQVIAGVGLAAAAAYVFILPDARKRKRRRKGLPPGIENVGNTCFVNALLQALAACTSFLSWLELASTAVADVSSSDSLLHCLRKFLLDLHPSASDDSDEADYVTPSDFISCLRVNGWVVPLFHEQDAYELYHMILLTICEELDVKELSPPTRVQLSILKESQFSSTCKKSVQCRVWAPEDNFCATNHWLKKPAFVGRLASHMQCMTCGTKAPMRLEDFDSLNLSFPSLTRGPHTVETLLFRFLMAESVSDVSCDSCSKLKGYPTKSSFIRQLHFVKFPSCLCIHIQRSVWLAHGVQPVKRHDAVLFKEYLDVSQFLRPLGRSQRSSAHGGKAASATTTALGAVGQVMATATALANSPATALTEPANLRGSMSQYTEGDALLGGRAEPRHRHYRLVAVIAHHGDVDSGHFVTYRRMDLCNGDTMAASTFWVHASDADVRVAASEEVFACQPYMLFYERQVPR